MCDCEEKSAKEWCYYEIESYRNNMTNDICNLVIMQLNTFYKSNPDNVTMPMTNTWQQLRFNSIIQGSAVLSYAK